MAPRNRGFTRWRHEVKLVKRTKKDFNEHYDNLKCECHTNRKVQNMMADTPVRSASWRQEERYTREYGNSWRSLSIQELRSMGYRKNVDYMAS